MTIPKKGSRVLDVDGRSFRYLVKSSHVADHRDQRELTVTVQENTEAPGRCLQFRWPSGHELFPNDVRETVRDALRTRAWDPSSRGAMVAYGSDTAVAVDNDE